MWKEFKEFAFKGNVVDMAVGVIIGGAFGKIVTSLVNDIIMPVIGVLTNGIDIKNLKYVISPATDEIAESAILYGQFVQNIVDFLIIAFSIFMVIRFMSKFRKKQEAAAEPEEPKGPTQEELLTEIRDLLKQK
ncbi:MAG: large-conductance mechanosensitive channel protein MscL [Clostridia bacterium]|nr:large-conductance mechanosensitive channel protein MscL [Clostridia bacterium]